MIFSILIAVLPLSNELEDYFVNGLYYPENPLFTASVSKKIHNTVLGAYYGRFNQEVVLSWQRIRNLVGQMFTKQYGGLLKF